MDFRSDHPGLLWNPVRKRKRRRRRRRKGGWGYLGEYARRRALREEWAAGGGRGEGKGAGGNLECPSALQPHSRLQPAGEEEEGKEEGSRTAQIEDRDVRKAENKEKHCFLSELVWVLVWTRIMQEDVSVNKIISRKLFKILSKVWNLGSCTRAQTGDTVLQFSKTEQYPFVFC